MRWCREQSSVCDIANHSPSDDASLLLPSRNRLHKLRQFGTEQPKSGSGFIRHVRADDLELAIAQLLVHSFVEIGELIICAQFRSTLTRSIYIPDEQMRYGFRVRLTVFWVFLDVFKNGDGGVPT